MRGAEPAGGVCSEFDAGKRRFDRVCGPQVPGVFDREGVKGQKTLQGQFEA